MKHLLQSIKVEKSSRKSNSLKLFISIIAAALIVSGGVLILFLANTNKDAVIATINGDEIRKTEFERAINKNRANVYDYFLKKDGVNPDKNFWKGSFGGESPINIIKERALKECTRIKVQQALGRKAGFVQDISYEAFLKKLKEENEARKESTKKKQVIYGPVQYGEDEYFSKIFDDMVYELIIKTKEDMHVSNEALSDFYEENKDQYALSESTMEIEDLKINLPKAGLTVDIKSLTTSMGKQLEAGMNLKELCTQYNMQSATKIEYEKYTINTKNRKFISRSRPGFLEEAEKLSIGKVSNIIESNNSLYIIKCLGKKKSGYLELSEVKEKLLLEIAKKNYEDNVNKILNEAKIIINKLNYDDASI